MALFALSSDDNGSFGEHNRGVTWSSDTYVPFFDGRVRDPILENPDQYAFPFAYNTESLTPGILSTLSAWVRTQLEMELLSQADRRIEGFRGNGGDLILPDRTVELK